MTADGRGFYICETSICSMTVCKDAVVKGRLTDVAKKEEKERRKKEKNGLVYIPTHAPPTRRQTKIV